jgi:protein ImuB
MFACIFIPDFPVEAIVRHEPLLRERAVTVLTGKAPIVRVIALNERARRMGMEIGMTRLQAGVFAEEEKTIERKAASRQKGCSDVLHEQRTPGATAAVLRPRSLEQEKSAHAALLDVAFGFSPRVEDTANDRVLLDLSGLERLYGSALSMARALAERVATAGLDGNIAVAPSPDSAMHAACGFSGVTVISAGEEARRLGVLPLSVMLNSFDIPREKQANSVAVREQILDTLERWGVRDFRTLAVLPEHALASRLGETGVRLQRLARGTEMRTLSLCEPEVRFEEAFELESPVEILEPLAFVLNRMLEQLCGRLESRALAAHGLTLRLQLERRVADEETTTSQELLQGNGSDNGVGCILERRVRLPVAMRDPKVFLKLLQLELAAHPPGAPVLKLWISAEPAPPRPAQRGLFLPLTPEAEKLEITLARIIGIVGEHRAGIARLLDTHRPDAFEMARFDAGEDKENTTSSLTLSEGSEVTYALRIFRPPLSLKVRTMEGRPAAIRTDDKAHVPLQGKVLWSAGPWRCSGDWWGDCPNEAATEQGSGPWNREEWDIALQHQSDSSIGLYRIYHNVRDGRWCAHACYD